MSESPEQHASTSPDPAVYAELTRLRASIDNLDAAMKRLGVAMRDIPIRRGSFKRTHGNLARDVAKVVTELDAARPIFRKK